MEVLHFVDVGCPVYNAHFGFRMLLVRGFMSKTLEDQAIEKVTRPKGTTLFRQGDVGDAAYIVNSGAVGIYREVEDRKVPLATLRKGELFGEMAVIDGSPRMATAFKLEDSALTMISVDLLSEKMKKTDPFIKALITMLLGNLRSVHDSYTPKARSLLDSVSTLQRQSDALTKYLKESNILESKAEVADKVSRLTEIVDQLRELAEKHGDNDRRSHVLPPPTPPAQDG